MPTLADRYLNTTRALAARGLGLGNEEPLASLAIDGAEAQEGVYSLRRAGDYAPVRRFYLAVLKPFDQPIWLAISFASAPGQFEVSVAEVRALVRRFHFDSSSIPKDVPPAPPRPVPPKPAPEPEPDKPKPHSTPSGAASPG